MESRSPCRVLVIEDQQVLLRYLELMLKRAGYDVVVATNGRQGIQILETDSIDLVLTDFRMPILDGLDVLRYVQQSRQPVPVVLMTAYGAPGVANEALRLGAFAYIPKPFEFEELVQILQQAMAKKDTLRVPT